MKNKLLLYADDSVILVSNRNSKVISEKLSADLRTCNEWLIDNQLSLHVGETEYILFGSRKRVKLENDFKVIYNDHVIKSQEVVKYLVPMDQYLNGDVMA